MHANAKRATVTGLFAITALVAGGCGSRNLNYSPTAAYRGANLVAQPGNGPQMASGDAIAWATYQSGGYLPVNGDTRSRYASVDDEQ